MPQRAGKSAVLVVHHYSNFEEVLLGTPTPRAAAPTPADPAIEPDARITELPDLLEVLPGWLGIAPGSLAGRVTFL